MPGSRGEGQRVPVALVRAVHSSKDSKMGMFVYVRLLPFMLQDAGTNKLIGL